jgi:hypothetical protein
MNPKLGDVGFKVGAKNYTLNMGVNAMCAVEYETERRAREIDPNGEGESAMEVLDRVMNRPRLSDIRLLFWGGLQRHHPTIDIETAGDMVQSLNGAKRKAFELILESIQLSAPKADDKPEADAAESEADPLPDAAADGTGTASS